MKRTLRILVVLLLCLALWGGSAYAYYNIPSQTAGETLPQNISGAAYLAEKGGFVLPNRNAVITSPGVASGGTPAGAAGGAQAAAGNSAPGLRWSGKKWVVVGDSITARTIRTNMAYYDYVAQSTGITVVNMGQSGTGYKQTENDGTAFYQRIWNVPADADVITIFGSGNDIGYGFPLGTPSDTGTDTLCGCINTTLDYLYVIKPTAQVGLVTPTPWAQYPPTEPGNEMEQYADAIVEICRQRSIPCLDLYHCSNLRPWDAQFRALAYSKDEDNGIHPDETGHALIAPKFAAFLENFLL